MHAGKQGRQDWLCSRSNSHSSNMPHFICRWPGGDVLLASVESRQELDAILQVRTPGWLPLCWPVTPASLQAQQQLIAATTSPHC
jgi:hypothetical protein